MSLLSGVSRCVAGTRSHTNLSLSRFQPMSLRRYFYHCAVTALKIVFVPVDWTVQVVAADWVCRAFLFRTGKSRGDQRVPDSVFSRMASIEDNQTCYKGSMDGFLLSEVHGTWD